MSDITAAYTVEGDQLLYGGKPFSGTVKLQHQVQNATLKFTRGTPKKGRCAFFGKPMEEPTQRPMEEYSKFQVRMAEWNVMTLYNAELKKLANKKKKEAAAQRALQREAAKEATPSHTPKPCSAMGSPVAAVFANVAPTAPKRPAKPDDGTFFVQEVLDDAVALVPRLQIETMELDSRKNPTSMKVLTSMRSDFPHAYVLQKQEDGWILIRGGTYYMHITAALDMRWTTEVEEATSFCLTRAEDECIVKIGALPFYLQYNTAHVHVSPTKQRSLHPESHPDVVDAMMGSVKNSVQDSVKPVCNNEAAVRAITVEYTSGCMDAIQYAEAMKQFFR